MESRFWPTLLVSNESEDLQCQPQRKLAIPAQCWYAEAKSLALHGHALPHTCGMARRHGKSGPLVAAQNRACQDPLAGGCMQVL